MQRKATSTRLFGSLLFFIIFNYPLLSIANKNGWLRGFPLLYAYIFGFWLLIIITLIILGKRQD